jgi:pimeloyl-ACP methyl ester carboxylesterase
LPDLDVPVLLIAGERDPFTSTSDVQRAAAHFDRAHLLVVPSSTHFTLLEFAELLHLRIEKFLRDQIGFDRYCDTDR